MLSTRNIYIVAAILFIVTAFFSAGFYHFDEHFQILEFGGLKLGLTEAAKLPWEFEAKMRPALQPAMVYGMHKVMSVLGVDDPFTISFVLRLFAAAVSFLSIHLLIKAFIDKIKGEKLQLSFILLSFFLWFSVYNSVRFSSENMGGRVFIIAFALFFTWKYISLKQHFLVGFLLGISFLFRYQNAFMIAGFVAWMLFVNKNKWKELLLLVIGFTIAFGIGVLLDRWFYEEWVFTTWKYFEQNILLNKAADFGVEPWYFYAIDLLNKGIPPFSILYLLPFLVLCIYQRKNAAVWCIVPFVVLHSYIAHKELRFLFPLIGFIPLLAVQCGEIFKEKWPLFFQNKVLKVFIYLFWAYNTIFLLITSFKAADARLPLFEMIYDSYQKPVKLYYIEDSPYGTTAKFYYFSKPNFSSHEIHRINELKLAKDTVVLFVTRDVNEQQILSKKNKLVYESFPQWIKLFNVGGWVERTKFKKVYELKSEYNN